MSEPPAPDKVRAQVARILASQTLAGSDQLKRLLALVVERTLNGQAELLKEYSLGLEVFQRPSDYDPKVDPIVRVQARRLRSKLDDYYATEGAGDPLTIQIPKGAYVPVFDLRTLPVASDRVSARHGVWLAAAALAVLAIVLLAAWMAGDNAAARVDAGLSVAVLPLQTFAEGGSRAYIGDQVAEILTTELAKSESLRVLSRTTASKYRGTKSTLPEIARALNARWIVEGGVGVEGTRAYVKLRTVDSLTDRKVWSDNFDCELSELVAANTQAAGRIAAAIKAALRSSPH
jgi:TolB-like protein